MARTLFATLGDAPAKRPLLDALLNLAPGVIQCMPALTNYWQRWRNARGSGDDASGDRGPMGGMQDSCYMWRRDGALARKRVGALPVRPNSPADPSD